MRKRWGSGLLLLCAGALVCLPSLIEPADRLLADALPRTRGVGELHYITVGPGDMRLDLNRATVQELTDLPDVGETLAQRIVEYRRLHGPFTTPRGVMAVDGIGEGIYGAIEPYITVAD